jgi:hypothetical protein
MVNRAFLAAGLAAGVLAAVGCDRMQLLAPTNSTVSLHADTTVLSTGGTTQVTATVLESAGTPVQNGTMVRFTTNLGRIDPVEVQTRNGLATTTFYAGDASGVADIRATSGAAGAGSSAPSNSGGSTTTTTTTSAVSSVVQISVGAAGVDSVTIQANPAVVPSNGGTVDVVATVLGTGNRALPGVLVTFTTTAGTLNPSSATTDAAGQAHTRLTTNTKATVKASVGGKTSGDALIDVLTAPTATLSCAVGSAAPPSGTNPPPVTSCSSVILGQVVTFTAVRGSTTSNIRSAILDFGDGTGTVDLGNLASSTVIPHLYSQPGDYNARLTITDINNETIVLSSFVHVVPPAIGTISVVIEGRTVKATANITGGTVLTYEWTFDTGGPQFVTTSNEASFTYPATTPPTATVKTISVKATLADGRTVTATTTVTVPAS